MKRSILFLAAFLMAWQSAFALEYVERRPVAIQAIKTNGPGSVYNVIGPDGVIRRMRVTNYQPNPKDQGLLVRMTPADNVLLLDFDDEVEFTTDPVDPPQEPSADEAVASETGGTGNNPVAEVPGSDLLVGVHSGFMAGLQVGIIESSGAHERIQKAYDRIAELQAQMGEDFRRVEQARINLRNKAVMVIFKAAERGSSKLLDPIKYGPGYKIRIRYAYQNGTQPGTPISWVSEDEEFLQRAQSIESKLTGARIHDRIDRNFHRISTNALIAADQSNYLGEREESNDLLKMAETAADVLVGLDPFTGTARSLYEAVTGENVVTGQPLTTAERIFATIGVATAGYALKSFRVFKIVEALSKKVAPRLMNTLAAVGTFFRKSGQGFEVVGGVTPARKVNFRSTVDPNWGLTKNHLNKHFFGESKYALKKIDSAGHPDQWMQNLGELLQRPVSKKLGDGIIEVHGVFNKTGSSGTYDLGVRLWEKPDGTFDLVTVLTRQSGWKK